MRHTQLLLGTLALFAACTSSNRRGDDGCTSSCSSEGETVCDGDAVRTCLRRSDDCLSWSAKQSCEEGETCNPDKGLCEATPCQDACEADAIRCSSDGLVQRCEQGEGSCLTWSAGEPCGNDQFCDEAVSECVSCSSGCEVEGEERCSGTLVQTCTSDSVGCRFWAEPVACAGGGACDGTMNACVSCQSDCSKVGATRCSGTAVQTCQQRSQGCLKWSTPTACTCDATSNSCKTDPCNGVPTSGRCTASGVEYCGVATGTGQPQVMSYACPVGEACAVTNGTAACKLVGVCRPGETQCASTTQLQTCSNGGAWTTQTCGAGTVCSASAVGASCVTASGTRTLTGTVTYEVRNPNASRTDWTTTVSTIPLPEIVLLSYSNGQVLDSTIADANGAFSIRVPAAPAADDTVTLIAAGTDASGNITFLVASPEHTTTGEHELTDIGTDAGAWGWAWATNTLTNNVTLNITEARGSGAARVFDYVRFAYNKALSVYGTPGKTIIAWVGYGSSWTCGACFAPWPTTMRNINFESQVWFPADEDESYWASSVTVHEMGHWVMASYGTDPDEGGTHYLGNPTFPGQAWSEGWATFFSTSSRQTPYYIDKQGGSMFWLNVDTRIYDGSVPWQRPTPAGGLLQKMDENEVSATLYKLSTSSTSAYNTILTALASTKMNRSPWARGYTRHTWDVDSSGNFTNVVDTRQSRPSLPDFLDTLNCNGFSRTVIDSATTPSTYYPYPSSAPLCQ